MMNYKKYLEGLKSSISTFVKAKNNGVVLTKREEFDLMFKKELAIAEGMKKNHKPVYKFLNTVNSVDFRIAGLYAYVLSRVMYLEEEGYSVKDIMLLFKDICKIARSKYIYSEKLKVSYDDSNSEFKIVVDFKNDEFFDFPINTKDEVINSLLSFASYVCSEEENDTSYKRFLNTYLFDVLYEINKGNRAVPLVDRDTKVKVFKNFIKGEKPNNRSAKEEHSKVIKIANYR